MRRGSAFVVVAAAGVLLSSSARAAPAEREVLAAEQARFEAMVRGDLAVLEPMLDAGLVYTHSNGVAQSKKEFLEMLRGGRLKYEAIDRRETRVAVYGETAVVTGRVGMKVVSEGKPLTAAMRFTDVYVRRAGRWRLAAWQSTRLPDP